MMSRIERGRGIRRRKKIFPPLEKSKYDQSFQLKLEPEICPLFHYFNTFSFHIFVVSGFLVKVHILQQQKTLCNSFLYSESNFYREQNIDLLSNFMWIPNFEKNLNINQNCICYTFQPFLYRIHIKLIIIMVV